MRRMFKTIFDLSLLSFLMIAFAVSCNVDNKNNGSLEYDSLDVNFSAHITGGQWSTNDVIGVVAKCVRNSEEISMGASELSRYIPLTAGETSHLVKLSDEDNIIARKGDYDYKFYAYAPYNEVITDLTKIPANIPASISFGEEMSRLYVAKSNVTTVIAPVAMQFESPSCLLSLGVPDDIVAESNTILKKMILRPKNASKMKGHLAHNATYNLLSGEMSIAQGTQTSEISIDFGSSGKRLESGYTKVTFMVNPFTVPEEGFEIEFVDVNNEKNVIPFLDKKISEAYPAGSLIETQLSSSSDGIIPCTSPVEWPIGYLNDTPVFTTTTQPRWPNKVASEERVWTSSQPQATISYIIANTRPEGSPSPIFETNNFKQYNYSAPCVKAMWTGDYYEFNIPVKRFAANTEVTITLPTYGRGNPLFWDMEYFDEGEWKCNRTEKKSPDEEHTCNCTLVVEHGNKSGSFEGQCYEVKVTFKQAIPSGMMQLRFKVADGSKITNNSSTYNTTTKVIEKPIADGTCLFAFVNKSGNNRSIKVEW